MKSYSIGRPLLKFVLFSLVIFGTVLIRTSHASAASSDCGAKSGSLDDYAGLIVSSYWLDDSGNYQTSHNTTVDVVTNSPSSTSGNKNIVHFTGGTGSVDARFAGVRFEQVNLDCQGSGPGGPNPGSSPNGNNDGRVNVVLGYGLTSPNWTSSHNGLSGWALDCDWHLHNDHYQSFTVTGHGGDVPTGARPGGSWSSVTIAPPNGATQYAWIVYTQPPPLGGGTKNPPTGYLDSVNCDLNHFIVGWAFDPDDSANSIHVHIYIDGSSGSSPVPATQVNTDVPRGDVNSGYGIAGNHGYDVPFSMLNPAAQNQLNQPGPHTIYTYGIGVNASGVEDGVNSSGSGLNQSPMTYDSSSCIPPAPPDKPPDIKITNVNTDCSDGEVTILATDPDYASNPTPFEVDYYIDGNFYSYYSDGTPFQVDMSGYSQFDPHYIYAETYGVEPTGGSINYGSAYGGTDPSSYRSTSTDLYGITDSHGDTGCQQRQFTAVAKADTPLLDSDENPTSADFNGGARGTITPDDSGSPHLICSVNINSRYYIKHIGAPDTPLNPPVFDNECLFEDPSSGYPGPKYDSPTQTRTPLPPTQPGDKVCMDVTVNPTGTYIDDSGFVYPDGNGNGASDTSTACALITGKPYFRTYGGDTAAGDFGGYCGTAWGSNYGAKGGIYGFNSYESDGLGRGAASQLAAMALKEIDGFTSAAGYGPTPDDPADHPPYPNATDLTFANDNGSLYGGTFGTNPCPPDFFTVPQTNFAGNVLNIGDINVGTNPNFVHVGPLNFTGGSLSKKVVIFVDGDLTITNNTTYAGYNSGTGWQVNNIPSAVYIATGNIYISSSVTEASGTFIAKNGIYTCINPGVLPNRPLDGNDPTDKAYIVNSCNQQLHIYGSFIAPNIKLLRTFKSLKYGDPNEPYNTSNAAEVFMFSPEEWLNNSAFPPFGGDDYDSVTGLPPIL